MDSLLIAGLLVFIVLAIVLGFTASSTALWLTARQLHFKDQSFRKATSAALKVLICSCGLYLASSILNQCLIKLPPLMEIVLSLLLLFLVISSFVFIISKDYEVDKKTAAMAFLVYYILSGILSMIVIILLAIIFFICLMLMMPLGLMQADNSANTITGWRAMYPLDSTMGYNEKGNFSGLFVNTAKPTISISAARVRVNIENTYCSDVVISKNTVPHKSILTLFANCPSKNIGDKYNLSIEIDSNYTYSGLDVTLTDKGTIEGVVGAQSTMITPHPQ